MPTLSVKIRQFGNFNRHAGNNSVFASPRKCFQGTYLISSPHFIVASFTIPTYTEKVLVYIQEPGASANQLIRYKLYVHHGS